MIKLIVSTLSAIWEGYSKNWGVILLFVTVVMLLGNTVLMAYKQGERNAQYEADLAKWKDSYEQAVKINTENASEMETLRNNISKFEAILESREQAIDAINQEVVDKEQEIVRLGKENEKIRADLDYAISCELWREIFPTSTSCPRPDQGGKTECSIQSPPTIQRAQ